MFRPEIKSMRGYVPGEQPPPGKFIKLNTNENPYPPSEAVLRAIHSVPASALMRYPDPTASAFRLRAAEILGVPSDWILCGNGSDDLLTIMTRAFVPEGGSIRFPSPTYVLYKTLAAIQGAHCDVLPFNPDWTLPDNFSQPAPEVHFAAIANPNSPSGTTLPPEQVLAIAQRLPCPLLVDEAYVEFADTNCLDLVQQNERILVSRSMSKSYSLAGLRFGYVVAQPQVIAQLHKVKDSYTCNALAILAATTAIDDQRWSQATRAKVLATRARLSECLAALGFLVQPSQANFVWCHHPGKPARELFDQLKTNHILVRLMEYDGWEPGLRITVGTDEQIDALLTVLSP